MLAPGVPLTHPKPHWSVELARKANVEVIGDIELFCREREKSGRDCPLVAITGTNGKSTTTALTAHLIGSAGRDAQMGGNIGVPVLALAPFAPGRVYVLEVSSYQIDLAPSLKPSVGILLNVTEDHLDRHGTLENYAAIKERLVAQAGTAVIGVDDDWTRAAAERIAQAGKTVERVSVLGALRDGYYAEGSRIMRADARQGAAGGRSRRHRLVARRAQCAERGVRDRRLSARSGSLFRRSKRGSRHFPALRIACSRSAAKATCCSSTIRKRPMRIPPPRRWRASATSSGSPAASRRPAALTSLAEFFPRIAKAYLIGEAAKEFAATLDGKVPYEIVETLDRAVPLAARDAAASGLKEPVVLLSPACASFDQYRNFEVRGKAFSDLVLAVPGIQPL